MTASDPLASIRAGVIRYDGQFRSMFVIQAGMELAAAVRRVAPTPLVLRAEVHAFQGIVAFAEGFPADPATADAEATAAARRAALALINRLGMVLSVATPRDAASRQALAERHHAAR